MVVRSASELLSVPSGKLSSKKTRTVRMVAAVSMSVDDVCSP